MFENKRLDEIEKQLTVVKDQLDSFFLILYGNENSSGWSGKLLALMEDVYKLKLEAKSDKLLPCPVCGDAPEVIQIAGVNVTRHRISCIKPRHSITTYGMTYEKAAEDWNRRNI